MKNINKGMFVVLLTPAYLFIFLLITTLGMGGIRWGYLGIILIFAIIGAWFSSWRNHLTGNIFGFLAFCASGGYIIVSSLLKPNNQKSGFEFLEIAMGVPIILFGLVPLLYNIVKRNH